MKDLIITNYKIKYISMFYRHSLIKLLFVNRLHCFSKKHYRAYEFNSCVKHSSHVHKTPWLGTSICGSHKYLSYVGIEPATRRVQWSCTVSSTTRLFVQSASWDKDQKMVDEERRIERHLAAKTARTGSDLVWCQHYSFKKESMRSFLHLPFSNKFKKPV